MADDAAHYSAKLKGELPGREKEIKKAGEEYGREAGQKLDGVVSSLSIPANPLKRSTNETRVQLKDAKREADSFDRKVQSLSSDAGKKFEEYKREAAADFNKNVDKFDKTVSQKAAESKSWFGSWFK
jgi:hypothetical protein